MRGPEGSCGRWLAAARVVLDRIETTQMEAIAEVASISADAIGAGGMVHLFGTGHSRIPLEEMFPRYGSYPGFHPIAELSMTFHTQVAGANGQRQAMFIERVAGLAEVIFSNFEFGADDMMIVFVPRTHGGSDRDRDRRPAPRNAGGGRHCGRPLDGRSVAALVGDAAARSRRHRDRHL